MKLSGYAKNHLPPSSDFSIPYIASLSTKLRAAVTSIDCDIRPLIEYVVKSFDEDAELVKSLRDTEYPPGDLAMRQMDLRIAPGEPIIFKCFVFWNKNYDCWHVLAEAPNETVFEDGVFNYESD